MYDNLDLTGLFLSLVGLFWLYIGPLLTLVRDGYYLAWLSGTSVGNETWSTILEPKRDPL
jgi:hypothetical protein